MWAAAETAIIIVGASIPFLRKLVWRAFRTPKSGNGYVNSTNGHWSSRKEGTAVRLGNITVKSNGYEAQARKADDGSEKSILGDGNSPASGILVSQHFTVQVDSDDSHSKAPSPAPDHW